MTSTPVESDSDPEKTGGLELSSSGNRHKDEGEEHHAHISHLHSARERLQHFIHPSGKRIHVVDSPQDEVNLRRKLQNAKKEQQEQNSDEPFDIFISGSAEHLEALRDAHAHHSDRKEALQDEHGEIYQRFADVHNELDALSHELDRVTSHGVSLEAHFSKFGYDAHIRTYDDDSHSPHASGTSTPRSSVSGKSGKEAKYEKGYGKPLKLFKVPVVRQYFHNGTLWRSAGAEEVQSFELFVDLLYVGIIAINGDATAEEPTWKMLLQFVITFTLSWKIWNDMTLVVSWFETDDIFQRVCILTLMAMLFGYTTNITLAFEDDGGTYATLIGFYVAARLFMMAYIAMVAIMVPMIRGIMIWYIVVFSIGVALWIASIHTPYPWRLIPIWIAIPVDLCGQVVYIFVRATAHRLGPTVRAWLEKHFEFWPAVNIEHRTERMNAFVTLVFGYSVVALLYQSTRNGIDAHYGKAVLGITQAFCFNWMYFEIDGSNLHVHAIRRHKWAAFGWTFAHLPFIMAFVLGSAGLSRLVLAVDTANSPLDDLTEEYRSKADKDIPDGIRWFYCAGYAVALAFMAVISSSHIHKHAPTIRLKKRWRLCLRSAVALILVLLPLATNLNSLQLVAIVTGLIVFALAQELWAASCCKEKLCKRSKPCRYVGHCQKKELEALVKQGKEVDWTQLSNDKNKNSGLAVCMN